MRGSLASLVLPLFLAACGSSPPPQPEHAREDETIVETTPPGEVAAAAAPAANAPVVRIETTAGVIKVRLDPDHAPISVANFLQYARDGFYDGTIFHRVIDDFMIQGGGFTSGMVRKETRAPIVLEVSPDLHHLDGAISMARTGDPNSATAQFFICDGAQPRLDGQYAVFGVVTEGLDVVRQIASVPTGPNDVPRTEVVMTAVRVE